MALGSTSLLIQATPAAIGMSDYAALTKESEKSGSASESASGSKKAILDVSRQWPGMIKKIDFDPDGNSSGHRGLG